MKISYPCPVITMKRIWAICTVRQYIWCSLWIRSK